ncbi:MAG: hypothetical protein ACI3XT_00865 [Butyricicoccaceae bacterium]
MYKRLTSLLLALIMCFALSVTAFAEEAPTAYHSMMGSSHYATYSWTNWTAPVVVKSNARLQAHTLTTCIQLVCDIIDVTETTDLMVDLACSIYEANITQVYYRYTYKTRVNDSTMQMQKYTMVEIYEDANYSNLIDVYTETHTFIQNLNRSI